MPKLRVMGRPFQARGSRGDPEEPLTPAPWGGRKGCTCFGMLKQLSSAHTKKPWSRMTSGALFCPCWEKQKCWPACWAEPGPHCVGVHCFSPQ